MRSAVAFFHRDAALSPSNYRPESAPLHGNARRALPAVFEGGAGHVDTLLLFGQFGQPLIDLFVGLAARPRGIPDLCQRESDLTEEEDSRLRPGQPSRHNAVVPPPELPDAPS